MGVWGDGMFENDDAVDLLTELEQEPSWLPVAELFEEFEATDHAGLDLASRAVAAAELVAMAVGRSGEEHNIEAEELLSHLGTPTMELVPLAHHALAAVGSSELAELWSESDDGGAAFRSRVADLRRRLAYLPM